MLSNKRLAITARIFDTGMSIPPGVPAATAIPDCTVPTATALFRSLDVIEPYNPVPFRL